MHTMKIIELNSAIHETESLKAKKIDDLNLKTTKRLLEKYKPRDVYSKVPISYRKDNKGVA